MCINCIVFLPYSQLNQKLRVLTEGSQNESSEATEPQPLQPSVSFTLHTQCISITCHTSLYPNTHDHLSEIMYSVL